MPRNHLCPNNLGAREISGGATSAGKKAFAQVRSMKKSIDKNKESKQRKVFEKKEGAFSCLLYGIHVCS